MPHKYLDCFIAMAERAKECDTPWDVLQYHWDVSTEAMMHWQDCAQETVSHLIYATPNMLFRIKPRTVTCTLTYPEPSRVKPEMGQKYYTAYYDCNSKGEWCVPSNKWEDNEIDNVWLNNGRIHLKEEDARAHVEAEYAGSRQI